MVQVGKGQTQTLGMCHPVPPVLILKDGGNGGWGSSRHVARGRGSRHVSRKTARFNKQTEKKNAGLANHSTDGADQIAQ